MPEPGQVALGERGERLGRTNTDPIRSWVERPSLLIDPLEPDPEIDDAVATVRCLLRCGLSLFEILHEFTPFSRPYPEPSFDDVTYEIARENRRLVGPSRQPA